MHSSSNVYASQCPYHFSTAIIVAHITLTRLCLITIDTIKTLKQILTTSDQCSRERVAFVVPMVFIWAPSPCLSSLSPLDPLGCLEITKDICLSLDAADFESSQDTTTPLAPESHSTLNTSGDSLKLLSLHKISGSQSCCPSVTLLTCLSWPMCWIFCRTELFNLVLSLLIHTAKSYLIHHNGALKYFLSAFQKT